MEVDRAANAEFRIDQPWIEIKVLGKGHGDILIGSEMPGLAPHMPAGVQRRNHILFVEAAQNLRNPTRQIVVEQDCARVEVIQAKPATGGAEPAQRLEHQGLPIGQIDGRWHGHVGKQRTDAHVETGMPQDAGQASQVHQVVLVARVALGHQQQVLRLRADLLDRHHRCLHAQRVEIRIQVVEATRE